MNGVVIGFEAAWRLTEVLLAVAVLLQSAEHVRREPWLYGAKIVLCALLLSGIAREVGVWGLLVCGMVGLVRYNGPYNGGADRMTLLILMCLSVAHLAPSQAVAELALGYLGAQLVICYFMAGWVKLRNPAWRSGAALSGVFAYSVYPVSRSLRRWAARRRVMRAASWGVIGIETTFPLALLHPAGLAAALGVLAAFHLGNALVFGLNRFFWIWLAAFPALIWLQARLLG